MSGSVDRAARWPIQIGLDTATLRGHTVGEASSGEPRDRSGDRAAKVPGGMEAAMQRMIKRTVAAGAVALALTCAGAAGTSGVAGAGVSPTTVPGTVEVSPGVYVLPTVVTQAPTQVAGVQLPRTGSDSTMPMVAAAGGLAAAGTVLVVATRRRRNATA